MRNHLNESANADRSLPYELPSGSLEALHARIRRQTVERPLQARRSPLVRYGFPAAAAVLLLAAGTLSLKRLQRPEPAPDIERILASAPAETLRQAAAENYDDILYNQQL